MISTSDTLVMVVDIQGKLAEIMENKELLFQNVIKLIKGAKTLGIPIVWVEQNPQKMGETTTTIKNELDGLLPISKMSFSCCGEPTITARLRELARNNILLCGIETHVCIYQTSLDLIETGYKVHVPADAVSSRTLLNKEIGLARIQHAGGAITSTEMCLFELLRTADHPSFKDILRIVK